MLVRTRTARLGRFTAAGVLALSLALVPAAFAAKGGGSGGGGGKPSGGGSGGVSAPIMVTDVGTAGVSYGDTVTFTVTTTASQPYVQLKCFQNGTMVAQGWGGYFAGSLNGQDFVLSSPSWTSGAADCTAYLVVYTSRGSSVIGSTSFHASA
jgi:hypothetical protein